MYDDYLDDYRIKEDISLNRIVDYTIDGLYESLKNLKEYKDCIQIMDSDSIIKNQVGKSLSLFGSLEFMRHWTYLSHFLKRMIFHYFEKCKINLDEFNKYFSTLESFFYEDLLEVIDISPLHHFQLMSISHDHKLVPIQASIILSNALHIIPLTRVDKVRLWNKFPISRLGKSMDGINYLIEYKFKARKGFDGTEEQRISNNTFHVFPTIVTLFRLVGIHCGIHDKTTATSLDLPIHPIPINLFVASLGIAYNTNPYVDFGTLGQFRELWNKFGELLVSKVLNSQRPPSDPFANLKTSIIRFNDAFERKDGEDQFIDNVVALEALFSKEDDKDDKSRIVTVRLSKRLALFLETDPHKSKDTFCEMVELYDQRSEIIHGGYTQKYDIIKTRNYLIRCYLKYFEFLNDDNFSHADFISRLDLKAKKFSMRRNDCQVKHNHNDEYNHSIPDFLFQ